mgnify:FL=1
MIFHLDHKSKASRDNALLNHWAQLYIPRIQFVKEKLQKFRELDLDELQSEDAEKAADLLLRRLNTVVVDGMHCHLRSMQWIINALSLSPEELQREYNQENCDYVNKVKQVDAEIARARKSEKEALERIARLEALLTKQERQTPPQQPTIAGSRVTLFPAPTTSQTSTTAAENPILTEYHYAP